MRNASIFYFVSYRIKAESNRLVVQTGEKSRGKGLIESKCFTAWRKTTWKCARSCNIVQKKHVQKFFTYLSLSLFHNYCKTLGWVNKFFRSSSFFLPIWIKEQTLKLKNFPFSIYFIHQRTIKLFVNYQLKRNK